jgi:hypothetical protein
MILIKNYNIITNLNLYNGNLNTNEEELETKFEDSELPPPIPPKRLEVNYCNSERGYDHSNGTGTAHEPKLFRPPPPLPPAIAEVLPILPPKTKYD